MKSGDRRPGRGGADVGRSSSGDVGRSSPGAQRSGNRLAGESSPYLRQHAENPVDWHPWGETAFASAKESDKPILLSVGYSACHWCHVMAHESFEDDATAEVMNEHFVNVKVDREERPDVDALYMEAVTSLTGHGGWPMTVFLTPDGEPFYAGTYYPPEPRGGMPSFRQVLENVSEAWRTRRSDVAEQARQITAVLDKASRMPLGSPSETPPPSPEALPQATFTLRRQYDPAWGGFGRAPKFPQTMTLEALLRSYLRSGDDDTLAMVTNSLDCMASGGIYDHLGGGFSRYSVDQRWIVPHFEKMLYDNALLLRLYARAFQVTSKPRYRQVAAETASYMLRDLRLPAGGFSSAEDADSEGEEGKFYVWTPAEIDEAVNAAGLDPSHAEAAKEWYGVSEQGNFEGANILWRPVRGDLRRPAEVEAARCALFDARARRSRPGLDDKALTEWNALAAAALAEAAACAASETEARTWLRAATECGEFLLANLRREDGRWMRSWQAGDEEDNTPLSQQPPPSPLSQRSPRPPQARHLACAADYAALLDAFTRLGEATGEARWIPHAVETAEGLIDLFWDDENGGLLTCGSDAEALVAQPRDYFDNATPSANSSGAAGLLRLAAITGEERYRSRAEAILGLLSRLAADYPSAVGNLLCAIDLAVGPTTEIVIVGERPDLLAAARRRYLPNAVLAWGEPYDSPLWAGRSEPAAYVCSGYVCELPVDNPENLERQLEACEGAYQSGRAG